jgi:hypothetical protein
VNIDEVQHFLDTVLITLFGAAFSPREEYLLLRLFQASIKNEMQVIKDIRGFIQAETVVPKMVITYNRRKQGVDYLVEVMGPLVKKVKKKKKNRCMVFVLIILLFYKGHGEGKAELGSEPETHLPKNDYGDGNSHGKAFRLAAQCDGRASDEARGGARRREQASC